MALKGILKGVVYLITIWLFGVAGVLYTWMINGIYQNILAIGGLVLLFTIGLLLIGAITMILLAVVIVFVSVSSPW